MDVFNFKDRSLKIVADIQNLTFEYTQEQKTDLFEWMFKEYSKFMMIYRSTYVDTLHKMINHKPEYTSVCEYLIKNIEDYGATKTYFFASAILTEKSVEWSE